MYSLTRQKKKEWSKNKKEQEKKNRSEWLRGGGLRVGGECGEEKRVSQRASAAVSV